MKTAPGHDAIDIAALQRTDIRARDWAAVHIAGDRRAAVVIEGGSRRIWVAPIGRGRVWA